MLPEDIHIIASGRLSISMTRVKDRKNVIVSEYPSRKDFIDALICSSFVPFYSGVVPPTFLNTAYVDGGLSDNLPGNELNTVTVSPFSGISSISPKDKSFSAGHVYLSNNSFDITLENMNRLASAFLPPSSGDLINLCRTGYCDAFEFLKSNGLTSRRRLRSRRLTQSGKNPRSKSFLDLPKVPSMDQIFTTFEGGLMIESPP